MKPASIRKLVLFVAFTIALGAPTATLAKKEVKNQAPAHAAVVNGKPITFADFQREVQLYTKRMQVQRQAPVPADQINKEVINDMIMRELVFQQSVKKGIKVDPQYVKDEMSAIQQRFGDQKQFEQWLSSVDMNEDKFKEQISQRKAILTLIDHEITPKVKVAEADTKSFYESNPNLFKQPEEVHAQHILIKIEKEADEKQKADARKNLVQLKKRIQAGEDFGQLAKANSQCPSASNNGDLGFFPKGRMVPSFEKAAFEMKPGQVSDIVETQFGLHLIKVLERRDAKTLGYEEVREKIEANLRNREIQKELMKYADDLRQKAKIETFVQ